MPVTKQQFIDIVGEYPEDVLGANWKQELAEMKGLEDLDSVFDGMEDDETEGD